MYKDLLAIFNIVSLGATYPSEDADGWHSIGKSLGGYANRKYARLSANTLSWYYGDSYGDGPTIQLNAKSLVYSYLALA